MMADLGTLMETGGSKARGWRGRGAGGLKWGGCEEEKSTGSVCTTWGHGT